MAQIGFDLSELESAPAADVIIDFSNVVTFDAVVAYVERTGAALVSGTTGYTPSRWTACASWVRAPGSCTLATTPSASLPCVIWWHRPPASCPALTVEIVETHHNQKVDAPSGTAKLLLDAVVEAEPEAGYHPVYGREGMCGARDPRRSACTRCAVALSPACTK